MRFYWMRVGVTVILGVMLVTIFGCVKSGSDLMEPWVPAAEFQREVSIPGVPVIRVMPVEGLHFDGSLEDAAWGKATAYRDFGLHSGTGLLAFPTSVRFLKTGRVLWVGLECRVPADRTGSVPKDAIDKEMIEVWVDPGPSRFDFYQVLFKPDGRLATSWVPAQTLAKGFQVKTKRLENGYTAEIRIDLDALKDFGEPSGANVGFNLARGGPGGWASLVGVVGMVHKPTQFWILDMTGQSAEVSPVNVYRDPFREGTDVRAAGRTIIEGWKQTKIEAHDRSWARMQVMIDSLQRKMAEDQKDPWGREQEIAVLAWRALTGWAAESGVIGMPESVAKLQRQLAVYPGGTYPATRWREEAFVSSFDNTAQPYALRVPANYDPSKPMPLLVFLHGSGTTHSGSGAVFERYDAELPCFEVRVNGRQYGGYDALAMRDTLAVIEDVTSRYAIDWDRIYVAGHSSGGFGSMSIGASFPQMFAGIGCVSGGLRGKHIETLKNVDVVFVHGSADPAVRPGANAEMLALEMQGMGERAKLAMQPVTGHGITVDRYEDYLLKFRRNAVPESVACYTDLWNPVPLQQYWVSIVALDDPHTPGAVRAEVLGDALRVQTANVTEVSLDAGELEKAGRGRPAVLVVDGQKLEAPAGEYLWLRRDGFNWGVRGTAARPVADPTQYRAGGITQIFAEGSPVIIAPAELMESAAKLTHRTVRGTSIWINIPVVKDTEVTEEMLRRHDLILVGSPKINRVSARLAGMEKNWPLTMENGVVTLDDKHKYSLSENVVEVVTYHPLNRSRRVWAVFTDGAEGLKADSPVIKGVEPSRQMPDITVIDIKSNAVVEHRLLTEDWKPEGRSMREE